MPLPKELEGFIDLVEITGVRVAVVSGGDYDLTTPDGRLAARIVGAVARKESEDRSRRVRRKHLELAERGGRPDSSAGGYARRRSGRWSGRPPSASWRATALMTIAKGWNRRGIPGATERPWTAKTLASSGFARETACRRMRRMCPQPVMRRELRLRSVPSSATTPEASQTRQTGPPTFIAMSSHDR